MERRSFLQLLVSGVVGSHIDVDRLLWEPNKKTIFIPNNAQIAFLNSKKYPALYGIPYHQSNACAGTWLGIQRSALPWDWKKMMDHLTIDPSKPLYIVDNKE